jgi:hypothetical protein
LREIFRFPFQVNRITFETLLKFRLTLYKKVIHRLTVWLRVELLLFTFPMAKTRAIRFTEQDEKLIQEFLKYNAFFDFSTLARTAILSFIQDPHLILKAVKTSRGALVPQERIER